jgi:hypothetical protein
MMPALAAAWAQLFGLISFEVFGQFTGIVDDREVFFAHAVGELARGIGLTEAAAQERGAAAPAQGDTGSTGAMPRSCDSGAFVKPVGR